MDRKVEERATVMTLDKVVATLRQSCCMEEPIISTIEEGENMPQLNEDHAHHIF
jgi:hypothetical protein